ncbi:hypothetical protein JB92DRAFT_3093477 [Gautieria morchelliformis]|nr:hypothetical protein JB92DRAFT_3093477 [Gautieria morchelliformis]
MSPTPTCGFLHLPDAEPTELTPAHSPTAFKRISTEVATINAELKGVVGPPYIVMNKAEGVPLHKLWDDIEDEQRTILLQQVSDILLELSLHHFDKIGSLLDVEAIITSSSHEGWVIAEKLPMETGEDIERVLSSRVRAHATDYWITYANARIARVHEETWGASPVSRLSLTGSSPGPFRHLALHVARTRVWTEFAGDLGGISDYAVGNAAIEEYEDDQEVWKAVAGCPG